MALTNAKRFKGKRAGKRRRPHRIDAIGRNEAKRVSRQIRKVLSLLQGYGLAHTSGPILISCHISVALRALTLFIAYFWVGYNAAQSFPILGQAFPVNDQHATCEDARSDNQTCDRRT